MPATRATFVTRWKSLPLQTHLPVRETFHPGHGFKFSAAVCFKPMMSAVQYITSHVILSTMRRHDTDTVYSIQYTGQIRLLLNLH